MKKASVMAFLCGALYAFGLPFVHAQMSADSPGWRRVKALQARESYAFLFVGDGSTDEGRNMLGVVKEVERELAQETPEAKESAAGRRKSLGIVEVALNDPRERDLIQLFRIEKNPTGILIAPNGAVTGYFAGKADKNSLLAGFVSSTELEVIKQVQEGKVVFLCFPKQAEPELSQIQRDLGAVADNFRGMVKVVYAAGDRDEAGLKDRLQISAQTTNVLIFVPPGRAVAKLEGADITKANLMRALMSSCGSGCGPGGCR